MSDYRVMANQIVQEYFEKDMSWLDDANKKGIVGTNIKYFARRVAIAMAEHIEGEKNERKR